MLSRLTFILGGSVLCMALAAMPANASESRSQILNVTCDGTNKHLEFNATGLNPNNPNTPINRFIQGAEITAVDTRGSVLYVLVDALNSPNLTLITTGPGAPHAAAYFTGFFNVKTDALGNILIGVEAACTPGPPLPLIIVIQFFS